MNKIFRASSFFNVPDGTKVASLFSSKDVSVSIAGLKKGLSIAAGEIAPGMKSKIHVHPLVSQVTFVLEGQISVYMKDSLAAERYRLELKESEAVLTQEGTFFQLVNESEKVCRVLYIVTPEFLFEKDDEGVLYNDAIVLEEDWEELAQLNWKAPELLSSNITLEEREKAFERIISRNSSER